MFELSVTRPHDAADIEDLLDSAFGANRKSKTSYRYRDGVDPIGDLAFVARAPEGLLGSIAYYPILIGDSPSLLLGPLAVAPNLQGRGIGASLMHHSMAAAGRYGYRTVALVGDPNYYSRFGFLPGSDHGVWMADEVQKKVQVRALAECALDSIGGEIRHWGAVRRASRAAA
ncbi:MAG: N-acetyltransferase [Rhodospirillales bacterium]